MSSSLQKVSSSSRSIQSSDRSHKSRLSTRRIGGKVTYKKKKKQNKKTKCKGGKMISNGAFGCVYNPALECSNSFYNTGSSFMKNKVSKLMTNEDATDEIKKYVLLFPDVFGYNPNMYKVIDPFMGREVIRTICITIPKPCNVRSDSKYKYEGIPIANVKKECANKEKTDDYNPKPEEFTQSLVMLNAGIDLSEFIEKKDKTTIENSLIHIWKQFYFLLTDIKHLLRHKLMHGDIKLQNITFANHFKKNEKYVDELHLIDFGKLRKIEKGSLSNGEIWYYYPIEYGLIKDNISELKATLKTKKLRDTIDFITKRVILTNKEGYIRGDDYSNEICNIYRDKFDNTSLRSISMGKNIYKLQNVYRIMNENIKQKIDDKILPEILTCINDTNLKNSIIEKNQYTFDTYCISLFMHEFLSKSIRKPNTIYKKTNFITEMDAFLDKCHDIDFSSRLALDLYATDDKDYLLQEYLRIIRLLTHKN